jgi:hypothetical protein
MLAKTTANKEMNLNVVFCLADVETPLAEVPRQNPMCTLPARRRCTERQHLKTDNSSAVVAMA